MFTREYPTVTAGRTLLNCSPAQFEQYHDPARFTPRHGLIVDLATLLGYVSSIEDGMHYIHSAEGVRFAEAERSERAAYKSWWRKIGLQEARRMRAEQKAWESFPRQGRRASSDDIAKRRQYQERQTARDAMFVRLEDIWIECRARLLQHSPQTEIWMHWALDRHLPRLHQTHMIGERRALIQALSELFDLGERNPLVSKLLDGAEATDTEISQALQSEMAQMACNGEMAEMFPRYALLIAVHLSQEPAIEVFRDMQRLLQEHDVRDREDLRNICAVANQ